MILLGKKLFGNNSSKKRKHFIWQRKSHIFSLALFTSEATKGNAKNMTLVFRPLSILFEISAILPHQARDQRP
jgi:hypothetical protein